MLKITYIKKEQIFPSVPPQIPVWTVNKHILRIGEGI